MEEWAAFREARIEETTNRVYNNMVNDNLNHFFDPDETVSPPHSLIHVWNRQSCLYMPLKPIKISKAFNKDNGTLHRDDTYIFKPCTQSESQIRDFLVHERGLESEDIAIVLSVLYGIDRALSMSSCPMEVALLISEYEGLHTNDSICTRFMPFDKVFEIPIDTPDFRIIYSSSYRGNSSTTTYSSRFAVIHPLGIRLKDDTYLPYGTIIHPQYVTRQTEEFRRQSPPYDIVQRQIVYLYLSNETDLKVAYNRSQIQQSMPFNRRGKRGDHMCSQSAFDMHLFCELGASPCEYDWRKKRRAMSFAAWKKSKEDVVEKKKRERRQVFQKKSERLDMLAKTLAGRIEEIQDICCQVMSQRIEESHEFDMSLDKLCDLDEFLCHLNRQAMGFLNQLEVRG